MLILVPLLVSAALASESPDPRYVLDNGLTVVLREAHERPLIGVALYVDGGGRTETDALKGLSYYYQTILFRGGTERQKELETRRKFHVLGQYRGFTTEDATAYWFLVPRANVDEALWRFSDAVFNVKVTEEKVSRDRQTVLQQLHQSVSDLPSGRALALLTQTAFRKHAYSLGPIGLESVINAAKADSFASFPRDRYAPNHMVLAAVGDFSADEMLGKVQAQFARYPRGKPGIELSVVEPPQDEAREAVEGGPHALSYLAMGFRVADGLHPDNAALHVISTLLTGGQGSRLMSRLRKREPLASSVWSEAPLTRDPHLFTVGFEAKPADEGRAVAALLAELARLRSERVPDAELVRVRQLVERDYVAARESYSAQAQALCLFGILGRAEAEPRRLAALLRVSAEEIQSVSSRTFCADLATLALVRPKADKMPSYAAKVRELLPRSERASLARRPDPILFRNRDKKYGFMQVVKEDRSSPIFSAAAVIRGGPLLEKAGAAGAAHLTGKMVTWGTAELAASEVGDRLAAMGVTLAQTTEPDHLLFSMTGPARSAKEATDLLMKLLSAPAFRPDDMEKARSEALSQIAGIEDDSFALADRELAALLYPGTAAGRHPFGTKESVGALSAADLSAYHQAAFVPRNVYVSVVGDVPAIELSKQLEAAASQLPRSRELPRLPEVPRKPPSAVESREVRRDTRQTVVNLGWPGVPVEHADALALRVAARMLGLRLFYKLVYDEGIAYRTWTIYPRRMAASPVYFQVGVAPENLARARKGLLEAAEALVKELSGPGSMQAELEDVRREIVQSHQLSLETAQGQAQAYAYSEASGLTVEFVDGFPDKVNHVRRGAIADAAKKYLDAARYAVVVAGKVPER